MVSKKKSKKPAYSLVELVIGLVLIALLAFAFFPLMQNLIYYNELDTAVTGFSTSVRIAQANSVAGKGDSGWGVKLVPGLIVVFKGNDFENRDIQYDIDTNISTEVQVSGNSELHFAKKTGNAAVVEGVMPAVFSFKFKEKNINLSVTSKGGVNY